MPRPKNTLTAFEAVMFPIAASANLEFFAANFVAKLSGTESPIETTVIAKVFVLIPKAHPNNMAVSPMRDARAAMNKRPTKKASHPFQYRRGGTIAKQTFQGMAKKCIRHYAYVSSEMWSSSSICGPSIVAILNCSPHVGSLCTT